MSSLKKRIFKKKYGLKLFSKVEDTIEAWGSHVPSEISIWSEKSKEMVGYWAYGWYDHELPYQGQDFVYFDKRDMRGLYLG